MNDLRALLEIFLTNDVVSIETLKENLHFSERKIRQLIKELRGYEKKYCFKIKTHTKVGYELQIDEKIVFDDFNAYLVDQDYSKFADKKERVYLIIYLLLQNKNYISLQQIADALDVSRSTIMMDMKEVKEILEDYELALSSKKHYGVKLVGDELKFRQLFSAVINSGLKTQDETIGYFEHTNELDFSAITDQIKQLLLEQEIILTENAWESIIIHLKILVSRVLNHNEVKELKVNKELITAKFYDIAKAILDLLETNFQVAFNEQEVDLLAAQIYGKATSESVPEEKRAEHLAMILEALKRVDEEYHTNFAEDELLQEYLLFHIYPMLLRISFGLELKNPILPTISIKYANTFLVSLRFIEVHRELSRYQLSRDEIGYLALHFAAHQERINQQKLSDVRRIVLISNGTRAQSLLTKTKIQAMFPLATIRIIQSIEVHKYEFQSVDLVLATSAIDFDYAGVPYFEINLALRDDEAIALKNSILYALLQEDHRMIGLSSLFSETLFFVEDKEQDYLSILNKYSKVMVANGYAETNFPESVLTRENRFTTIYDHGLAGPHSMEQNAMKNSILVVLLPEAITHEEKVVKCIFLLNIKKKQLFLHQEISEFFLRIMDDALIDRISHLSTFYEFKRVMKKYW